MPSDDRPALLTHIAHELRTPLSVALGYTKMLGSGRFGPLNEKQTQALAAAERCCQQIQALADQLSLAGKLERGELALAQDRVALDQLLADLASQHAPVADHPVNVQHRSGGTALAVTADATHLRRTLTTMLAAVIRTAPDESTVIVTARAAADIDSAIIGIAVDTHLASLLDAARDDLEPLNDMEGGLGLGLLLARLTLTAQGASAAGRRTGGVLAVRLTLPLSS